MKQDMNGMEGHEDEMRAEYDFSSADRGKYFDCYQHATNIVDLDPDAAEAFKGPESASPPAPF